VIAATCSIAVSLPAPVHAGGSTITVRDGFFDPDVSTQPRPGHVVPWDWYDLNALVHNVRQDKKLFYSGAPTAEPTTTFSRTFSAGIFHYHCEVHGSPSGGMDGRIRVPVAIGAAPSGLPFTVRWSTLTSDVGEVFDVQFRVDGGSWRTWKTDTSAPKAVFGKDAKPVAVHAGHSYAFRARTQAATDTPIRRSDWSPVRSFQT
jgi:plastocyanin